MFFDNLTKVFTRAGQPDFTAVNHISFELHNGECLGIIGESGSGKSTTVNMITRLLDSSEGSIILDGKDITKVSGKQLKSVYRTMQMVFQTPTDSFDPRCTLGDGIGESLRNNGWSRSDTKKEVVRLLEQCGLSAEFADRYPHQVSGGQCQRIMIARAVLNNPKILFFDEATSALDNLTQKQVVERLSGLKCTRISIAHRLSTIEHCDRIIVLDKGVIVEDGSPEELYKKQGFFYKLARRQQL